MEVTLANGRKVEIKNINLATGQVDYKRLDDPVYEGDLVLYHTFINEETVDAEVLDALNASEVEREAAQTEADEAKEALRLAEVARLAAKAQAFTDNLPSWLLVDTAVNNIASLADAKVFIKKLARVVYWLAKDKAE